MNTVWLAWWDNGLEYDDWRRVLVGVYTDKNLGMRDAAAYGERMKATTYSRGYRGFWWVREQEVNQPIEQDE